MNLNEAKRYTFDDPYNGGEKILVPSLLKWLARSTLSKLKAETQANKADKDIDFDKAEGLLESFLNRNTANPDTGQAPAYAYCPKITARPFWDKGDAESLSLIHKLLHENFQLIKDEYNSVSAKGIKPLNIDSGKGFLKENAWKNIKLGTVDGFNPEAEKNFPLTISVLENFKEMIFSCEFIVMEPDTELPPHVDATNTYLVSHMGLNVSPGCGIRVSNETKDFKEGDIIFFDQSYPHSAWNKGDDTRVNILISFFHPEISQEEKDFIHQFNKKLTIRGLLFSPLLLIEYGFLKLLSLFKKT